jgi:uncharacterized protein with FMN-binding domain
MASLLRRGLPAVVLAGTGAALLARFDHTEALTVVTNSATAAAVPAPTTLPTAPSTTRPSTAAPAAPSTSRPSTATTAVPSTTSPSPTLSCAGAETLGPVVQTRWGPVQVAAVISKGKICDVRAVVVPSDRTRSMAINNRAVPILHDRVLASQSAAFQTVSGATVTSEGYRSSLQAILNSAK